MGNIAENVIQKWADYVNQSNFQKLLGLYAPDSTMIPTFFKKILLNSSEIQEYFFMLSEWETTVEIFEESFCTKRFDMGYLVNGEYTFNMNCDEQSQSIPARFSFLLNLSREDPILLHHSSAIP